MTTPDHLPPSTRRAALVVARLMFFLGLMLGMLFGIGAFTLMFTDKVQFATPGERWMSGGVFVGLSIMAFGFGAIGKARIDRHRQP